MKAIRIFIFSFITIIFVTFSGICYAAIYYVSPSGSATWSNCNGSIPLNGTSACSCQTAMANAVAGDMVYFRGGTYEPGVGSANFYPTMNPANSGTAENYITFQAYPGETAIIHEATSPSIGSSRPAIGVYGRNYIIWDGFVLDRNLHDGIGASSIVYIEQANNIIIRNNDMIGRPHKDHTNGCLIYITSGSNISIYNNKLHGMSADSNPIESVVNASAVWVFAANHVYIYNNDIYNNVNGLSTKDEPNYLYWYNNHIWNCSRSAFNLLPQGSNPTIDIIIYQNVIRNCTTVVSAPDATQVFYNLRFYNNTVYNSSAANGVVLGNGRYDNSRNAEIFNNIFYHGGNNSLWERYGSGEDKPAYADNNNFYGNGRWSVGATYRTYYNTIADWRKASKFDLNSLTSNPLFVNPGSTSPEDYRLKPNSPAKGSGRNGKDIGAYPTGNEIIGHRPR